MKNLLTFLFILFFVSCSKEERVFESLNTSESISIYLVKQDDLELHEANFDLSTVELESTPWVTGSDIEFYDWSAHTFYLNREVEKEKYSTRHFVVTSGEKRIFAGVFFPMYLSSIPQIPSILPEDGYFNPKDIIRFSQFGYYRSGNLDENIEFKNVLISSGLFRAGIDVQLNEVKKLNSASLEYSFTITNNDEETLYLLDPQKMGESRFHFFTNGVSLVQNESYFWPNTLDATNTQKINSDWYVKLPTGKSISRKVKLGGFAKLPTGKVEVTFHFPGAKLTKTRSWKKPDGRIWLGDIYAKAELTLR